jgi:hypothetical protein
VQIPQRLRLVYCSWLSRGSPRFVGFARWMASQHFLLMPCRRHCRCRTSSSSGPRRRARRSRLRVCGTRKEPSASKSEAGTSIHQQFHCHVSVLPNFHYAQWPAHLPFGRPSRELDPIARTTGRSRSATIPLFAKTALDQHGERLLKRIRPATQRPARVTRGARTNRTLRGACGTQQPRSRERGRSAALADAARRPMTEAGDAPLIPFAASRGPRCAPAGVWRKRAAWSASVRPAQRQRYRLHRGTIIPVSIACGKAR